MNTLNSFIHLLALILWMGSIIFFSFFAAPAIFKKLERKEAGELIGAIFPKYYAIGYLCSVVLAYTLLSRPGPIDPRLPFLVIMAACTLYAGLVINPQARKLKEQMYSQPENRETLESRFKSLHGWSVRLNASVLIFGLGLLWITAMHLSL